MNDLKMFDIICADLSKDKVGSEQSGIRPYIIIQNNMGNKYCPTVLGMALTTKLKKGYMPTHCVIHKNDRNGLKNNSMLLGETLTQISKERIRGVIGRIEDEKTQKDIINVYIANVTGKNRRNNLWYKLVNMIFFLIKEDGYENAI